MIMVTVISCLPHQTDDSGIDLIDTYWKVYSFNEPTVRASNVYVELLHFTKDSIWISSQDFGCFPQEYYIEGNTIFHQSDVYPDTTMLKMRVTSYNDSIMTLRSRKSYLYATKIDIVEYNNLRFLYCD